MIEKNKGFTRVVKAFGYSCRGLRAAYKNEAAFRQELFFSLVLFPIALWLNVSTLERITLIGTLVFVLVVELLNSGIESVVDRVGYEHHELAGRAKDMASAAVMISLIFLVFVWVAIIFF